MMLSSRGKLQRVQYLLPSFSTQSILRPLNLNTCSTKTRCRRCAMNWRRFTAKEDQTEIAGEPGSPHKGKRALRRVCAHGRAAGTRSICCETEEGC